jgi:transposase
MPSQNSPVKATKRRHTLAFKRKLVGLTNKPGASVAAIALEHGVNANLVFKWKREQLGRATAATPVRSAVLLPVTIDPLPPMCTVTPGVGSNATRAAPGGVIEIEFGGARVRIRGAVDQASVRCVLQTLREAA